MANEKRLDLIDRGVLRSTIIELDDDCDIVDMARALIKCVREAPTVDAVEVVHGRWIVDDSGVIICSECGAEHEWLDYRATFCEDCGAKMDGGNEDVHTV